MCLQRVINLEAPHLLLPSDKSDIVPLWLSCGTHTGLHYSLARIRTVSVGLNAR